MEYQGLVRQTLRDEPDGSHLCLDLVIQKEQMFEVICDIAVFFKYIFMSEQSSIFSNDHSKTPREPQICFYEARADTYEYAYLMSKFQP